MPNHLEDAFGWFNETTGQGGTFKPNDYTPLAPLPALPSNFAPPSATGNVVSSKGSGASGNLPALASPPTSIGPANPMDTATGAGATISDYFIRGILVVLGFIFVGVGLKGLAPNVVAEISGRR